MNIKKLRKSDASSAELKKLAVQRGIDTTGLSVDKLQQSLAESIWEEQHPGEEMPEQIAPMLLNDITHEGKDYVNKTFTKENYWLQHKLNGERLLMQLFPDDRCILTSRSRSVKTFRYSELDGRVLGLRDITSPFINGKTVLDGEVMMPNAYITLPSGVETKSTLQSTVALMHMEKEKSLQMQEKYGSMVYRVFDILVLDGKNVENLPYRERADLAALAVGEILKQNPSASIEALPTIRDYESAWDEFEKYVNQGGEGLIVKKLDAPYERGKRTKGQWKLKAFSDVDGFVTDFVPSSKDKGLADYIGGLVFSSYVDGRLREIAAVSNIDLATRKAATSYDAQGNPILNPEWKGKVAALIGQDWNQKSLRLNSARINEWRDDKDPEDCQVRTEEMKFNTSI